MLEIGIYKLRQVVKQVTASYLLPAVPSLTTPLNSSISSSVKIVIFFRVHCTKFQVKHFETIFCQARNIYNDYNYYFC